MIFTDADLDRIALGDARPGEAVQLAREYRDVRAKWNRYCDVRGDFDRAERELQQRASVGGSILPSA